MCSPGRSKKKNPRVARSAAAWDMGSLLRFATRLV